MSCTLLGFVIKVLTICFVKLMRIELELIVLSNSFSRNEENFNGLWIVDFLPIYEGSPKIEGKHSFYEYFQSYKFSRFQESRVDSLGFLWSLVVVDGRRLEELQFLQLVAGCWVPPSSRTFQSYDQVR